MVVKLILKMGDVNTAENSSLLEEHAQRKDKEYGGKIG